MKGKFFPAIFSVITCAVSIDPLAIRELYTVWSNHFDAGFTGFTVSVANQYFSEYFPRAISTARALREAGGEEQFVWTTEAPWLVDIFLRDCEASGFPRTAGVLRCPDDSAKSRLLTEVRSGGITWGAMPFSSEIELMDRRTFVESLNVVRRLEKFVGRNSTAKVLNQRDVPGLTSAAIPTLVSLGIRAVTVGVNGASAPPAVPSQTPFIWRDPASGVGIIAFWHPRGYAGNEPDDLVVIPGGKVALATIWKSDNEGPHTVDEVKAEWARMRKMFPNAKIIASTHEEFVERVEQAVGSLPELRGEIGDTWIYGVASDPLRMAKFSSAMRAIRDCAEAGDPECDAEKNKAFDMSSRMMVKVAEHTWGVDVKTNLHDDKNWSNVDFNRARSQPNYVFMEKSWKEQRQFLDNAVDLLGDRSALGQKIKAAWAEIRAKKPDPQREGFEKADPKEIFECSTMTVGFDSGTGAISHLKVTATGQTWATGEHKIAQFVYQTFTEADYDDFLAGYMVVQPPPWWGPLDFGKPNVHVASPEHRAWTARISELWIRRNNGTKSCEFAIRLRMDDAASKKYGGPADLWLEVGAESAKPVLEIGLAVLDKTPTRLPESMWMVFDPLVPETARWTMTKVGRTVDPTTVIVNGSSHLHAVDTVPPAGMSSVAVSSFRLDTVDAPLVSIGKPLSPFPLPLAPQKKVEGGVAVALENNIWGTNYAMWCPFEEKENVDDDIKFRFKASF